MPIELLLISGVMRLILGPRANFRKRDESFKKQRAWTELMDTHNSLEMLTRSFPVTESKLYHY